MSGPNACAACVAGSANAALVHSVMPPTIGVLVAALLEVVGEAVVAAGDLGDRAGELLGAGLLGVDGAAD